MRGGVVTNSGRGGVIRFSSTSVRSVIISLRQRLGVQRVRIAIGRQLQRVEAEDLGAASSRGTSGTRVTDGMLWRLPSAISAMSAMPLSDASTASVCASFQA